MPTSAARYNLNRDKKVLGKQWLSTYGRYFSDQENIRLFIKAVKPFLPNRELNILYIAAASGLLGESLIADLGRGRLTITDISQKHLAENKNIKTRKIRVDLLEMNLGCRFDLVIMRSSLDYFSSRALQIKALKVVKKHLGPGGLFVNQPAYIPRRRTRDTISAIYNQTSKIGNRFFQSADMAEIYAAAGFHQPKKIGTGKTMIITENDHIKRYGLNPADVQKIRKIIGRGTTSGRKTKTGYALTFKFPIFMARVKKK